MHNCNTDMKAATIIVDNDRERAGAVQRRLGDRDSSIFPGFFDQSGAKGYEQAVKKLGKKIADATRDDRQIKLIINPALRIETADEEEAILRCGVSGKRVLSGIALANKFIANVSEFEFVLPAGCPQRVDLSGYAGIAGSQAWKSRRPVIAAQEP